MCVILYYIILYCIVLYYFILYILYINYVMIYLLNLVIFATRYGFPWDDRQFLDGRRLAPCWSAAQRVRVGADPEDQPLNAKEDLVMF